MSLPCFITHCLNCNSLCEQMSLPCFNTHCCIVTPCVNNESSLLQYPLFAL
ncbi:hypothetical protein KSS87_017526 [Heliosperma pusillum]|nr:hypothetical protein KSS87_017526 [Heliosperma pusillum]